MSNKVEDRETKPKKKHKGLIIFLVIFGILVVFPVGFIFAAFFTTETKQVSAATIHYENIVSESFHEGIKKLDKENPQLDFTVNNEMIDGIMMAGCEKINQLKYIPKMYCYINEDEYTFFADLQAAFFKTRVSLVTRLFLEGEGNNEQLVFKINKVILGRLPIPLNWVIGILGNFINDSTLDNAFAQSGFHITSDLANARLTYKREIFKEDVGVYLAKLGGNNPYLNILLNVLGDESGEKPILTTKFIDGVTATFNLRALQIIEKDGKKDAYYTKAPLEFDELDNYKEMIIDLLNNHGLEEKDVANIYTYLIRGFNKSNKQEQEYISGLKDTDIGKTLLSNIGSASLEEYKGGKYSGSSPFEDYCKETIPLEDVITWEPNPQTFDLDSVTFSLSSDELNAVLASKLDGAIGNTVPITFKEDGVWYCDYVTVDNVYTGYFDLGEDKPAAERYQMALYFRINIAGAPVTLAVITDSIATEGAQGDNLGYIKFKIKDIYFGSLKIEDRQLIEDILKLVPQEECVFSYNKDQFQVDIEKLIENFGELPEFTKPLIVKMITEKTPAFNLSNNTLSLTYSN